jgi:non-ribosomal peptide synthetase component E (peptide arylation enzyme)
MPTNADGPEDTEDIVRERTGMTHVFTSPASTSPHLQAELFRPSLRYPAYPYGAMLTQTAARYPEHVALVFNDVNLTYRELEALVNAFAHALRDLGIKRGQMVCLLMTNRAEYVISWFAIVQRARDRLSTQQ